MLNFDRTGLLVFHFNIHSILEELEEVFVQNIGPAGEDIFLKDMLNALNR